ncbi:YitT family protein [Paenibacillus sp. BR1-192]|uniref:YitT family protein n=1 Tax=Paenibacillus sp. BR1-192 TaxID=3032287 RepID=UPI00240D0BEB|nr:YitT family protein [Paenibacillus sp. BR1-192]WFB60307.1 YitT family protein [Paenibacillus sp. BR1-192]
MVQAPVRTTNGAQEAASKASTRRRLSMAAIGGLIAAFGLDLFLVPSGIIAGGVTGISALASHLTGLHTGMFLFALNLPLLLLAYRRSNREKAVIATVGLLTFSVCSILFFPIPALIDSKIGSAGIGGIFLGLGIGIGLRYGVVLDTLQMPKIPQQLSQLLTRLKLPYVHIMINLLVLTLAGLLLGWERAMYSAIACLMALETGRVTTSSLPLKREVRILSISEAEIRHTMKAIMGYDPLSAHAKGEGANHGDAAHSQQLVYRVHILEMPRLKSIVFSLDPNAEITIIQK